MTCGECKAIKYCSQECQNNGWNDHKNDCDRIKEDTAKVKAAIVALTEEFGGTDALLQSPLVNERDFKDEHPYIKVRLWLSMVSNAVNAFCFLGGTFSFYIFSKFYSKNVTSIFWPGFAFFQFVYFLERHSLALRRVTAEEAKKVLSDKAPDSKWLFGENIKESMQKIRDTGLISKAFVARANFGKQNYRLVLFLFSLV